MPFIDDGEIQAYLDGAYDVLSGDRLAEIEARIADDPEFARRVDALRRSGERASEILGEAVPVPVEPPPFEELQRRAANRPASAQGARRRLPAGVGLAWAATVVLALGTGWFVGREAGSPAATFVDRRLAEPVDLDRVAAEQPADEEAEAAGMEARERQASVPDREVEALSTEPTPPVPGTDPGRLAQVAPSEADAARDEAFEVDSAAPQVALARARSPLEEAPFRSGERARVNGADHAPHGLAIPGLEVLAVSWNDAGTLSGLRIDHRLPGGGTLELLYVGLFSDEGELQQMGRDDAADALASLTARIQEAANPPGWKQVLVRKEARWLLARGPISEAEIRAYLMTLP